MKLVIASSNKGKIKEIKEILDEYEVIPFTDLISNVEIVEDGKSFKENALIKARVIFEKLGDGYIVISDDSGISVPLLGNEPNIYSARYAGENASDRDNLNKLVDNLKAKGVNKTPAYYTASIAIVSQYGEYSVHGWMYGDVIDTPRGDKGFGYDPIFIPNGYDKSLGELDDSIKKSISHRSKALKLAKPIIKLLNRNIF